MQVITSPIICFALLNIAIILLGYWFVKKSMIALSWIMLAISVLTIHLIFLHQSPVLRMLAIIATTFTGMKVIAVAQAYKGKPLTLKYHQWLIFAMAWAGMRAEPFEKLGSSKLPNAWPMIRFGISKMIIGLLLILIAHVVVYKFPNINYLLINAMLLIGLSLIIHFGLLSISAGIWRLQGVNTYYLFKQPATSTSLTEFWGKRWNIAFSEMTAITIFQPLKNHMGSALALIIAFLFSGLLHELALSLPVNSGYSLPMIYFIIQGVLVLIEKTLKNHRILFLQNKIIARLWVFLWLVIPMPLLFHTQFIKQIVWPLVFLPK